jgi:hypothetical protein
MALRDITPGVTFEEPKATTGIKPDRSPREVSPVQVTSC